LSIVERLYAPISERPSPGAAIDASDIKDNAIALRRRRWKLVFSGNAVPASSAS
jgi:hypothetical protein